MIKGVGIDTIEIDRIKAAVKRHGDRFLNRIYTPREIEYCRKRKELRFPELAARFAAKEAYMKALGTGMNGTPFNSVEVVNDPRGKPLIALKKKIKPDIHLSLTHSRNYASAVVVIEA